MRLITTNRRRRWLAGAIVALACSTAAPAETEEPQPPWDVPAMKQTKVWVPWVVAFLFAAGCVLVAFKNPHRSHLD
jgi:hypothetical protein